MQLRLQKRYVELGESHTFIFEPLEAVEWQAGQYINLSLPGLPPVEADRLFTIASAPFEKNIMITTYLGSSPFKQRLALLQPGELIEADQVGGDFTWQETALPKLFIAGGIGVTCFRSIVLNQLDKQVPVNAQLLYAGKESRRPFVELLQEAAEYDTTFTILDYVDTRLTVDQLLKDIPDATSRVVYIAGSQPFSETIGEGLITAGLPRQQLKYDYFDGYASIEY